MAFNWFISVIQSQSDLIQTSDVRDPPPTKDTARLHKQQQMRDMRGGGWGGVTEDEREGRKKRDREHRVWGKGEWMEVREGDREREREEERREEQHGREEREEEKEQRGIQDGLGDQGSQKSAEYMDAQRQRQKQRKGKQER